MNKLNIGCGNDYKKDYINLDYNSIYKLDVNHNLNKFPYPFEDEYFVEIYASHILEHIDDLFKTMDELLRILKKDGIIHIRIPHFSNGLGYSDLSHKRFFGYNTFKIMESGYYNREFNFEIIETKFNFLEKSHYKLNTYFSWIFNIIPKKFYERFLCWIIPVGEIEIKLRKIV